MSTLARVLRLMSEADINVLSIAAAVHSASADKILCVDAHCDLRLFIHNKVVDLMLRQHLSAQQVVAEKEKVNNGGNAHMLSTICTTVADMLAAMVFRAHTP